jgi:hypothetical protein
MKPFSIAIWAPRPAVRAATARLIDSEPAAIGFQQSGDGRHGRIDRANSIDIDERQKGVSYRPCFIWSEWHALETQRAPQVTWIAETLQRGVNALLLPSVDLTYGGVACTILS